MRQHGFFITVKNVQNSMARSLAMTSLNKELKPHSLRFIHTSLLAEFSVSLGPIMD